MDDLISRAEAVKAICGDCVWYNTASCEGEEWECDSVNKLRSLPSAETKTKCIAQIKVDTEELVRRIKEEYDITDGWIPCSERLPEPEEKIYWVCTDGGYQCQCRWTNINHFWTDLTTDWHWHIGDVPQYSKVIAWRPLPEPWKGADDENVDVL